MGEDHVLNVDLHVN